MAGRPVMKSFSRQLALALKVRDGFGTVLEASMCVRNWVGEALDEPPTCPVCGALLENDYLAFREESDLKKWHRVCKNRVWCRAMKDDPPDPAEMRAGGAWFRRVADLYRNVTF